MKNPTQLPTTAGLSGCSWAVERNTSRKCNLTSAFPFALTVRRRERGVNRTAIEKGNCTRKTNEHPAKDYLICRMRRCAFFLFFISTLALAQLVGFVPSVSANVLGQLKIVVNQLDDATTPATPAQLAAWQDAMNKILAQCDKPDRRYRVTLVAGRPNQHPTYADGKTEIAANGVVPDKRAVDALNAIGKGPGGEVEHGGVKIWVAKQVDDCTGWSAGDAEGNLGEPTSVIQQQNGIYGDKRTWTHELCHDLGLEHVEGTLANVGNLMFPARVLKLADGTKIEAGTTLTDKQCDDMYAAFKKRAKFVLTKDQIEEPWPSAPGKWFTNPKILSDPTNMLSTAMDISSAYLAVDHYLINPATNSFYADIYIGGIPDPAQTNTYTICLDLDNNPSTGSYSFDLGNGETFVADAVVQFVIGLPANEAILFTSASGQIPLSPPTVVSITQSVCGETNGWEIPSGALISGSCPLNLLGPMSNEIRVLIISGNATNAMADRCGPEVMSTVPLPEPTLQLSALETLPGGTVYVTGSGFASNSNYRVLFDDVLIAAGVTGLNGELSSSITAPQLAPGDYLVDVIDDAGFVQIVALRILSAGVPTVSEGGLIIMGLLLLTVGAVFLLRHQRVVMAAASGG
ncbi:MAG: hypothetical protein ABSE90_05315 [Verrucomicrobiota bacterium]|jgi:hypothetical protein